MTVGDGSGLVPCLATDAEWAVLRDGQCDR